MGTTKGMEKTKGITGTGLKLIALIAMFIDHFAAVLLTGYLVGAMAGHRADVAFFQENKGTAAIYFLMLAMRLIGRFGFPLFAFLIVEGFQHTHSVKKYALNLGIFALISELPFNLGFASRLFYPGYQNVFLTLLFGLLGISCVHFLGVTKKDDKQAWPLFYLSALLAGPFIAYLLIYSFPTNSICQSFLGDYAWIAISVSAVISLVLFLLLGRKWDTARKNAFSGIVLASAVFCIAADLLHTDYGAGGVLTILILYLLRKHRMLAFSMACLELTLYSPLEFTAFLMLIPVAKYNGKRGKSINKYVFYGFYPVHLGLLYLVTLLLGFTGFALK